MSNTRVILAGLKHSGKSTLALRLAEELSLPYFDLDRLIETEYRTDRLVACRDIYRRHGRRYFMSLETQAAKRLSLALRKRPGVGALGGGTCDNAAAVEALVGCALIVYLRDGEARLFERIMRGGLPAFLPKDDPSAAFHELYLRRDALYRRLADVEIDIDGAEADEAYSRLRTVVLENRHAR